MKLRVLVKTLRGCLIMKKGWIGLSFTACLALCPTSAFAASQFSFEKLCIENGNPLSGAQFTLRNQQGNVIATAVSENNGETTFSNIPDGQYQLIESMPPKNYIPAAPMYVSVENGQVFIETTLDNGSNIFVYDALSLPIHSTTSSSTVQSSTAMTPNSTVGTSTLKTNSTTQSSETTHSTSSQTMSQNTTTSGEVSSSHQSSTPNQTTSAQKTEHSSTDTINQSVESTTSKSHASTVENSNYKQSTSTSNRSASSAEQTIERPKENRNSDVIPSAAQDVINKISDSAAKNNDTLTHSSVPSHSQHGRIVQQLHVTPYGTQHIMIYEDGYQQKASGKPTLPQTGIKSTSWMTLVGIGCIGASLLLMRKKYYE